MLDGECFIQDRAHRRRDECVPENEPKTARQLRNPHQCVADWCVAAAM
jgi:hypothetical protein